MLVVVRIRTYYMHMHHRLALLVLLRGKFTVPSDVHQLGLDRGRSAKKPQPRHPNIALVLFSAVPSQPASYSLEFMSAKQTLHALTEPSSTAVLGIAAKTQPRTTARSCVRTSSFVPAVGPPTASNAVAVDQGALDRARGRSNVGGVVGRV